MQFECKICGKLFLSIKKLSYHLRVHNIKPYEYYDQYFKGRDLCIVCGKKTRFISLEKGYSEYCSSKCSNNSNKVKEKKRKTCLINYGVTNPMKSSKIRRIHKKIVLDNYNVENPSKSSIIKKKKLLTYLKHYGTIHPLQNNDIKEKKKETCLKNYGVENPSQHVIINKKIKESYIKSFFRKLLESNRLKGKVIPNFSVDDYQGVEHKYSWTCSKCGNIFEDHLDNGKIPRCPICYPPLKYSSKGEKEIVELLQKLGLSVIENSRSIIYPLELDIYIPSHKLAIEFNGLYWHSELNGDKDKNYHLNKTQSCEEKGIQLLHIFEDEWIDKQEIVKSVIRAKLGLIHNKIFARKCQIQEVPNDEAKLFLFDNHLQGLINGIHLGLYYEDELVSLLSYGKSRFNKNYQYEILRFCNKLNVVVIGGLSKLLKQIESTSIITYADLRYGTGSGYLKCGFNYLNQTPPSYYYLDKNYQRISRFQFQKHLLQEKLDIFDPNLTEWQNMQLNGYDRIWDCGTKSYKWNKQGEL